MIVKLYDLFGTDTLRHRDTADTVLKEVSKTNDKVVLDFSGIIFTSRSFSHELIRGLSSQKVSYINMMPEVEEMMNLVFRKPKVEFKVCSQMKKLEVLSA